jgi:hypothetical protein
MFAGTGRSASLAALRGLIGERNNLLIIRAPGGFVQAIDFEIPLSVVKNDGGDSCHSDGQSRIGLILHEEWS